MKKKEPSCVACLHAPLIFFGRQGEYLYYRCPSCYTLQLYPLPDTHLLSQAYGEEYAEAGHCQHCPHVRNQAAAPQFDAICSTLLRHANPSLVLDCGSGWGGLLQILKEKGIAAEGAELSAAMADFCVAQGFAIHHCALHDIHGESKYDAILLSSVFEHLVAHESWLLDVKRLLKKGGLVVSLQPTATFALLLGTVVRCGLKSIQLPHLHQIFWPPWHTVLFSLDGMRKIMERNGFILEEVRPAPLQRERGITGLIQRVVSTVNRIAVPIFDVKWPLCVGHIFVFRFRD